MYSRITFAENEWIKTFLNSNADTLDALENSDKECTNTVSKSQNVRWVKHNCTKEGMTNRCHINFTIYLVKGSFQSCMCRILFTRMQENTVKTDKQWALPMSTFSFWFGVVFCYYFSLIFALVKIICEI